MVKPSQNWECADVARHAKRWICTLVRFWNTLVDALMWPGAVEIRHVLREDTPQVLLAHNHHVVEAFTSHAAQQSFADRVRPRSPDRRTEDFDPGSDGDSSEVRTVLRVIVTNQILGCLTERGCLSQLLGDPLVIRRPCYADMDDASRAEFRDDESE